MGGRGTETQDGSSAPGGTHRAVGKSGETREGSEALVFLPFLVPEEISCELGEVEQIPKWYPLVWPVTHACSGCAEKWRVSRAVRPWSVGVWGPQCTLRSSSFQLESSCGNRGLGDRGAAMSASSLCFSLVIGVAREDRGPRATTVRGF